MIPILVLSFDILMWELWPHNNVIKENEKNNWIREWLTIKRIRLLYYTVVAYSLSHQYHREADATNHSSFNKSFTFFKLN